MFLLTLPALRDAWQVPKDSITPRINQQIFYLSFLLVALSRVFVSILATLYDFAASGTSTTPQSLLLLFIPMDVVTNIAWLSLLNAVFYRWSVLSHQISFHSFHVWWLRYKCIGWTSLLFAAVVAYGSIRLIWEFLLDIDSVLNFPAWLSFQICYGVALLIPSLLFITTLFKLKNMLLSTLQQIDSSFSSSSSSLSARTLANPPSFARTNTGSLDTFDSTADLSGLSTAAQQQQAQRQVFNNSSQSNLSNNFQSQAAFQSSQSSYLQQNTTKRSIVRSLHWLLIQHIVVLLFCVCSVLCSFLVIGPFVHLLTTIAMYTMLSRFQPEKILLHGNNGENDGHVAGSSGMVHPHDSQALNDANFSSGGALVSSDSLGAQLTVDHGDGATNPNNASESSSLLASSSYIPPTPGLVSSPNSRTAQPPPQQQQQQPRLGPHIRSTTSNSGGYQQQSPATPMAQRRGAASGGSQSAATSSGFGTSPGLGVGSSLVESYLAQSFTGLSLSHESASNIPSNTAPSADTFRFNNGQQQQQQQPSVQPIAIQSSRKSAAAIFNNNRQSLHKGSVGGGNGGSLNPSFPRWV